MKLASLPFLALATLALTVHAQDVSQIAVPWPPPAKPADSPFAGMTCASYATYKHNGDQVDPKWGDIDPTDFGSRSVAFDTTGIRELNQVPAPGVHPRIFCTPADLPDIRRRIKETRCGQEAWKDLLCYTNFMKGTYDEKADYAQPPTGPNVKPGDTRVPLMREGFGGQAKNQALAATTYAALVKGDTTADPKNLWNAFSLEAFRCWIDDDHAAAHDLAAAVTTALKIEQAKRDTERAADPKTAGKPLEQPVAGIQLAYIYDFLYNDLNSDQRKAIHDELANGTWSHDNYGTFNAAVSSRSNWATFSYWLIEVLAIEGEPGFNDLKVRGMYRGWRNLFTYGWFSSGATYEGEAKNQLGMDGVLAFAIRAKAYGFDNLVAHPYLRAYATNFLPKSVIPTRDGFVKYDLLGGCHGKPLPEDLIGLKYLLPNDKVIDWVYRSAIGENYENVPNRAESGMYDPSIWGSYHNPLIPFLIFASDFDPANDDPSKLGVSNTFFCPERALMMTRSSWDKDAMMLNLHVRQANGGHPFADRNSIMVAGAGRVWSPIYGWGDNGWWNVHNSEVVIDDHPQADHIPGRMVDFEDQTNATFAVGDASYAWDWNWQNLDGPKGGTYLTEDIKNGTIDPDPRKKGWQLETHSTNDFNYIKQPYDYLNQPLSALPHWLKANGAIWPIERQTNYPVQRAFRTAGLVRGPHPYALVVDDIQKDDQPHDYVWYMTLEYDVQIAKMSQPSDHELDLVLTGSDPAQAHAPGVAANQNSNPPLAPTLDAAAAIPTGQPMLLVRFLNLTNSTPSAIVTEAKTPTILEDGHAADSKSHYVQPVRRLAVPVRTVSPDFKVLIYAYHQGDPLPATSWTSANSVTVAWPDQKDQVDFTAAPTGKTDVTVTRGADVLVKVDKAVEAIAEAAK
jgi:hypothetical protein